MALAPGNNVRQSFLPGTPNLLGLIKLTLFLFRGFCWLHMIYLAPLTTLLIILLPALFGGYVQSLHSNGFDPRTVKRLLLILPVAAYVLLLFCFRSMAFMHCQSLIPGRAHNPPISFHPDDCMLVGIRRHGELFRRFYVPSARGPQEA